MELEKLIQWMEIAQNMNGGDFWKNIFDQEFARQFINDQPSNNSSFETESKSPQTEKATLKIFPLMDILEDEKEVIMMIEIPGINKETIQLGLSGDILTIKGSIEQTHPHLKRTYSERYYGDFERRIKLPDLVSSTSISAQYWEGILIVSYQRISEKMNMIPID